MNISTQLLSYRVRFHYIIAVMVCLLLGTSSTVLSQTVVRVSDANGSVKSIVSVTVTGIVQSADAPLTLVLEFDRTLLEPKSVTAGTVMTCASPQVVSTPIAGTKRGKLEISCSTISAGENNILCTINFLVLAGDSSTAIISPVSLIQTGKPLEITPQNGSVTITGSTFKKLSATSLGTAFPNPFPFSTKIPYTLGEKTPVRFSLFTLNGNVIQEFPEIEQDAGTYTFEFIPEINIIGTAPYILRMDTRSSSQNTIILLTKN